MRYSFILYDRCVMRLCWCVMFGCGVCDVVMLKLNVGCIMKNGVIMFVSLVMSVGSGVGVLIYVGLVISMGSVVNVMLIV